MVTAEDLRVEFARSRAFKYKIAAAIDLHPSRLSAILNGHVPLLPDVARRIQEALEHRDARRRE